MSSTQHGLPGKRIFLTGFWREVQGAFSLEAVLILPIAAAILLFLIIEIHLSYDQMALDHAVHELTDQVATHLYAVKEAEASGLVGSGSGAAPPASVFGSGDSMTKEGTEVLAPLLELGRKRMTEELNQTLYRQLLRPILLGFVDRRRGRPVLRTDRLQLEQVEMPDLRHLPGDGEFGVEASYTIHPIAPFIPGSIVLKAQAYERIWAGGV